MTPPLPSRHRTYRFQRLAQRLAPIEALLDIVSDRSAPLPRATAGAFRRTLREARHLLGLAPSSALDTAELPFVFLKQTMMVRDRMRHLNMEQQRDHATALGR